MLLPLLIAAAVAIRPPRSLGSATPLRGVWLVPLLALCSAVIARIQRIGPVPLDLNRILAAGILAGCAAFVVLNRRQRSRLVLVGVVLTAAGGAANALGTLVYGYMPVLDASARALGSRYGVGGHPDPQYVMEGWHALPVFVLGDWIPVRPLQAVFSVGDLALVPGLSIVLAAFVARVLSRTGARPQPITPSIPREEGIRHV